MSRLSISYANTAPDSNIRFNYHLIMSGGFRKSSNKRKTTQDSEYYGKVNPKAEKYA